ncbi:MAG: ABC transporter permease [Chloroflexota bacterium]|nr:ABC transporter permease [Chloroflexota bacterium]
MDWIDLWNYVWSNQEELIHMVWQHLTLVILATGVATFGGVSLGILITRPSFQCLRQPVMVPCNVGQVVPSLAILSLMMPLLGIGFRPAFFAILIYILLPITRNTYVGIREVDPAAIEAARGMGMSGWQILTRLELPLAGHVILAGIRTSMVIAVGVATLATFIGAGGLGDLIDMGLSLMNPTYLYTGAILAALLAIGIEIGLSRVERHIVPKGLSEQNRV